MQRVSVADNEETLRAFSEQYLMHQIWLIFITYNQLTFL